MKAIPSIANIHGAFQTLKDQPFITQTRLDFSRKLSERYSAKIYLKREDMQTCRTFKTRGAYYQLVKLKPEEKEKGIVGASDGTFCYALAYACQKQKVKCDMFLPKVTSKNKIDAVANYGKEYLQIHLEGDCFDEANEAAIQFAQKLGKRILHPFDDDRMIEGNGTITLEILKDIKEDIDYIICPMGGGGLAAGIASTACQMVPDTKIVAAEPDGAARMTAAVQAGKPVTTDTISRFCDGSAVKMVGQKPFEILKSTLHKIEVVPEGRIATTVLNLYDMGIIVETAAALSVAALEQMKDEIKDKVVVCILTGSNTDLSRLDTIREHSLMFEGLKNFFLINFPLRQGILREYVQKCLGPTDEISHIQFNKKPNRERAPALIAIEVQKKEHVEAIKEKMQAMNLDFQIVNENKELYDLLV